MKSNGRCSSSFKKHWKKMKFKSFMELPKIQASLNPPVLCTCTSMSTALTTAVHKLFKLTCSEEERSRSLIVATSNNSSWRLIPNVVLLSLLPLKTVLLKHNLVHMFEASIICFNVSKRFGVFSGHSKTPSNVMAMEICRGGVLESVSGGVAATTGGRKKNVVVSFVRSMAC